MSRILNKLYLFFLRKTNSITIKRANLFTTLFIFFFTIVFAYLLIVENYYDYERAIYSDSKLEASLEKHSAEYNERQKKLKTLLIKNTLAIVTLSFILFSIMLGFFKIFNTLVHRDMQAFLDFFRDTAHNEQVLNPNVIFFKEFKTMVGYANGMVDTISEQKRTLQELNAGLENKVKKKTADLEKINNNLIKEKKFSEDILDSQKEFLRYTVHETNTPLSVILTSLELYQMKHEKDKHLSKIEAAAKNIFNIYDDLSYLVKKEQVEYPKIAIDISNFVKSRIDFFSEVALLSKIEFNFISEISNDYIYFNETKLQRIIDNTITNAIKYTYQNEVVEILLKSSNLHVEFSMGSHSQLIQDVDRIFDEYYRENTHTDKVTQGFGIGLRLVKNICDEEEVNISITSDEKRNIFTYLFKVMGN